jgi:cytochrome c553
VLLDPPLGVDGPEPLTRLTPEVCFPEIEGWPGTFYANPYPLSERYFLAAWSDQPVRAQGSLASVNGLGLYLVDAFGNRELIYRAPDLGAAYPLPLRPRIVPTQLQTAPPEGPSEGRFVLLNVYAGLTGIAPGTIKALRIVHVPPKTQPNMNTPVLGVTRDDPGKCVLGTVPVEADGSAHFRAPAGTGVFFQALDGHGFAVQTMRSLTYLQPGEALSCIGCHEPRNSVPSNQRAQATGREASKLKVGPEGSWPLRFDRLVQPVLDDYCVRCHNPDGHGHAAQVDLTAEKAWETLVSSCDPSIRDLVLGDYRAGKSTAGAGIARRSDLIARLTDPDGHHGVRLPNEELQRIILWADLYGQRLGAFSDEQERRLIEFRGQIKDMLEE